MTLSIAFQTPPRILVPMLVQSHDARTAKATARKAQRKALEIRVRDLETSYPPHRQRAEALLLHKLANGMAHLNRPFVETRNLFQFTR